MSYILKKTEFEPLMERYSISSLCARILAASSYREEQILDLLDATDAITPSRCQAVDQVCRRIMKAKEHHEKVFVAGDYDADGICSTAIMKDTLDRLDITNGYYIQDRFKEGYGLNRHTVELVHEKGYSLIITVDNGVKCHDAIQTAKQLGMDVIVTDHHEIDEPACWDILLHPSVMEPQYEYLSGAGVVLQLSLNLLNEIPGHVALACIALIGDVMPLWKETRRIVRRGCGYIRKGELPAVLPLLRKGAAVDETALAFQVVPRLNSVGRMNDSSNVNSLVPFLLDRSPNRIRDFAVKLNRVNDARRRLSDDTVRIAEALPHDKPFPILFDESFHEGVVGLAAGKLARQWHKPVMVFARSDDLYKGSGRSIPGLNLFEFFKPFEEPCAFGGHAMAVGLSIPVNQFDSFLQHVSEAMDRLDLSAVEEADAVTEIEACDLTLDSVMELESLKPFPKDMITTIGISHPDLQSVQEYEKVTKYRFEGFEGVQFGANRQTGIESPEVLIGTASTNRFRDRINVQVLIDAFSLSGAG